MIYVDYSELVALKNGLKYVNEKKKKSRQKLIEKMENEFMVVDYGIDYIVTGQDKVVLIERKTHKDLYSSIINGRVWKQVQRMKEFGEYQFQGKEIVYLLIIEGSKYAIEKFLSLRGIKPGRWLRGVILSFTLGGVGVIRSNSLRDTIEILELIDEKLGKDKNGIKEIKVKRKKELNNIDDERVLMLCGVNGVGTKRASILLSQYGSVKNIVNLSKDELVKMLGEKVGSHFYDVVNGDINEK